MKTEYTISKELFDLVTTQLHYDGHDDIVARMINESCFKESQTDKNTWGYPGMSNQELRNCQGIFG